MAPLVGASEKREGKQPRAGAVDGHSLSENTADQSSRSKSPRETWTSRGLERCWPTRVASCVQALEARRTLPSEPEIEQPRQVLGADPPSVERWPLHAHQNLAWDGASSCHAISFGRGRFALPRAENVRSIGPSRFISQPHRRPPTAAAPPPRRRRRAAPGMAALRMLRFRPVLATNPVRTAIELGNRHDR
jgi:hypothetical protein